MLIADVRPRIRGADMPFGVTDPAAEMNAAGMDRQMFDAFDLKRMCRGAGLTHPPRVRRRAATMLTGAPPFLATDDEAWVRSRTACQWRGWVA